MRGSVFGDGGRDSAGGRLTESTGPGQGLRSRLPFPLLVPESLQASLFLPCPLPGLGVGGLVRAEAGAPLSWI